MTPSSRSSLVAIESLEMSILSVLVGFRSMKPNRVVDRSRLQRQLNNRRTEFPSRDTLCKGQADVSRTEQGMRIAVDIDAWLRPTHSLFGAWQVSAKMYGAHITADVLESCFPPPENPLGAIGVG